MGLDEPMGPLTEEATRAARLDPPVSRAELRELGLRPRGLGLVELDRWPEEPSTPAKLAPERLARALDLVCDLQIDEPERLRLARWILRYGREFRVDPLLIAAFIAQQSRCRSYKHNSYGLGLGMIHPRMVLGSLQGDRLTYRVKAPPGWRVETLRLGRFRFDRRTLLQAEPNIYFTAALLSVFQRQCPDIDLPFHSTPHRHFVSHFIWGDRVLDSGPEDRVLLTRRRLISYYNGAARDQPRGRFEALALSCPLDGAPRKVTSVLGDIRENGRRRHTGVDIDSTTGEPVRAVASGTVVLAGVDWGDNRLTNVDPALTRRVAESRLGPRGLLVKIEHREALTSIYMHLSAYTVRAGQKVARGELIGYVGGTGIKESPPHLHFELWQAARLIDPLQPLAAYLIAPHASYRGRQLAGARAKDGLPARRRRGAADQASR